MVGKRYSTEQIIVKLREAEIEVGRGLKIPEMCRKLGISEQTFYRWRKRYGGLRRNEVRRLKVLELEDDGLYQIAVRRPLALVTICLTADAASSLHASLLDG